MQITIENLFGLFTHRIPMQSPDRVTIIHGANGLGKTVMLRMIASFVEGKTAIFERTPFERFCVTLA
jgi:ABC-type transport system involved in cytochrome c biogenesis ATPase subunit